MTIDRLLWLIQFLGPAIWAMVGLYGACQGDPGIAAFGFGHALIWLGIIL